MFKKKKNGMYLYKFTSLECYSVFINISSNQVRSKYLLKMIMTK